jgi:transposase
LHGLKVKVNRDFLGRLEHLRTWKGKALGRETQGELRREYGRLKLVEEQIRELERAAEEEVQAAREDPGKASPALRKVVALKQLRGVNESAWPLVREFFGWREFRNRREVGSLAGLTGTPYQSGDTSRDLGISKAGNRRIRALMVELAWSWLRYQPHSKLSVWYQERFGPVGKRNRRVGIVALARKLLVALWKYVENSELPEGAELKAGA